MFSHIKGVLTDTIKVTDSNNSCFIKLCLDHLSINDENENIIVVDERVNIIITAWPSDMKFIENFCRRTASMLDINEVDSIIRGIFLNKTVFIKALTKSGDSSEKFYKIKDIKF